MQEKEKYYELIKNELLDNEINKKVKDYSKNRYELQKYYNVGKLLFDAGKHYGESIIKEYSKKLKEEINKKYSVRYLFDIRKLYLFSKVHPLGAQLTMSHYRLLFPIKDDIKIKYYIGQIIEKNLSKRQLENSIKNKEYERLPIEAKNKTKLKKTIEVKDLIPNPILIQNQNNIEVVSEKTLHKLILENIESFMRELGGNLAFVGREYK